MIVFFLSTLSGGLAWELEYGANVLSASVLLDAMTGDFDSNGDVDGSDFLYWRRNGLSSAELLEWQDNFGASTAPAAQLASVPEPSNLVLSLIARNLLALVLESPYVTDMNQLKQEDF